MLAQLRTNATFEVQHFDCPKALLADAQGFDVYLLGLDEMNEADTQVVSSLRALPQTRLSGLVLVSALPEAALVTAFDTHDFDSFLSKDWVSPAQLYLSIQSAMRSAKWRVNSKCSLHDRSTIQCAFSVMQGTAAE